VNCVLDNLFCETILNSTDVMLINDLTLSNKVLQKKVYCCIYFCLQKII